MLRSRKGSRALSGATVLAALSGALLIGPAASAEVIPGSYEAHASTAVTPVAGAQTTVSLTFINDAPASSFDFLHHAAGTFPAGFSGLSGPATATSSDPTHASFTVTYSGLTVSLSSAVGIPPTNGEVTVDLSITTPAFPGVYSLTTSASGTLGDRTSNGAYTRQGDEPTVSVGPAAGTTYCFGGQVCDTGLVGSESNTLARIVTTGGGNDAVTLSVAAPQYTCANGQNQGQQATYTTNNLTRTVNGSLELDKSIVNAKPDNGAAHYAVCYQSKTPFTTANGTPAGAAGGFFVGQLAACSATNNVEPCLLKLKKTGSGDMFASYLGQAGDPGGVWQYTNGVTPGGVGG